MVAVWRCGHLKSTCTREFGSAQRSVDAIDAHWNSHWASRLLNRFESGFSVDAPLDNQLVSCSGKNTAKISASKDIYNVLYMFNKNK